MINIIYVVMSTNNLTMVRRCVKAFRNPEDAIFERDRLNSKWEGRYRFSVDMLELFTLDSSDTPF